MLPGRKRIPTASTYPVVVLCTLAIVAIGLPNPVAANTVTNTDAIDEVLVTATRRPVTTREISTSVNVLDGESVRYRKLATDALAANVGVNLQQTTPGQGAAIIRGLKGSAILHLVDGMRLNNAIFRSAPTQYLALVPTSAVERIEVLRGTPTSLYGSDAVTGIWDRRRVVDRTPIREKLIPLSADACCLLADSRAA